ncbi:MAG: cation-translocating P-type ATPase [Firmicutes bacterium]|nr:cation-translocating P-type ATPase [Bacillota bacterium]
MTPAPARIVNSERQDPKAGRQAGPVRRSSELAVSPRPRRSAYPELRAVAVRRRRDPSLPRWPFRRPEELARELETDLERGLASAEAAARLALFGPNELARRRRVSPIPILVGQLTDFMVLVLVAAAFLSLALGEVADAAAILAIVVLNATLGFIQEYRAERALERLRELTAPAARVLRDGGREKVVPARELVPGDVVLLEAGDRVPADLRLVEAHALRAQEAALTGESAPVDKVPDGPAGEPSSLADLQTALFAGTEVTSGRGRGVVVATGMETEFGKVAGLIQEAGDDETPLQKRMAELGRYLVLACLVISGVVVWAGLLRGEPIGEMFLTGVSLAVAAIPEGLPAVVTVLLALGVQRMIGKNVIVRRLPAVETLGCATVVCTDKTGTLTLSEMTVRRLWTPLGTYEVTGRGYDVRGDILPLEAQAQARAAPLEADPALRLLLIGGALCSDARLVERGQLEVYGDPTEGALLIAALKAGLARDPLEHRHPRLAEIPFSPERRRMTTVHAWAGEGPVREGGVPSCGQPGPVDVEPASAMLFCKGAPDTVVGLASHCRGRAGPLPLTPDDRRRILAAADELAAQGLRVLAVAYRPLPRPPSGPVEELERSLVLAGLAGLVDPPRPEAKRALEVCRRAGVRVSMVTGDHPATALAAAAELGLLDPGAPPEGQVLTGRELDLIPERVLARRATGVRVYARVSPAQKLKIVRALKAAGEVVAMTGDGVNDAPALREADIGVAMGRTGTAVTKEASDMVLVDDNFASIVSALEEGRVIYDNIRRSVRYLLACNTGEILTMLLAALGRLPLPLLPLQILWVNLATDGLPAMALGFQRPEADVARRPPRPPGESIFARRLGVKILGRGLLIGLSTLAVFLAGLRVAGDLALARTLAFATLVLSQLIHAFDCRSETRALTEVPLSSNWHLVGGTAISFGMLLAAIYVPELRSVFRTVPLGPAEWAAVITASGWGQVAVGLRRVYLSRSRRRRR